jgi:c-di-GMP-binding flagellar brake protein YcgR
MAEGGSERRRHARLDIALSVRYIVQRSGAENSEMAEALSTDVSATGLRLMTPTSIGNGSIIDIEIVIEGKRDEPVKASAEVVWENKISDTSYEVGCIIRHMDPDEKKRFLNFVFEQMNQLLGMSTETP